MKKLLLAAIMVAASAATASAIEITQSGHLACASQASLEEVVTYLRQGDLDAAQKVVLSGVCVKLKPGLRVFAEPAGGFLSGLATIRFPGELGKLWVLQEATVTE